MKTSLTQSKWSESVLRRFNAILVTLCLILSVLFLGISSVHALTPAGAVIKNQASATFKDNHGVERTVTSNTVETMIIQQVAGVLLSQDQSRLVTASSQAVFSHVLTNTGNSSDSFTLQASNVGGDAFNFTAFSFFTDADQNGIADVTTPITSTPCLAANSRFYFVAVAQVPGGLAGDDSALLSLSVVSSFDGNVAATNTDTAIISNDSVVEVMKSIDQRNGATPSGAYTITLNYNNPTSTVAISVVLIDALPAGMTYVPGSGRWSKTGGTVLTDSDPADAQGSGTDTIAYCSYHASCNALPEAIVDTDTSSINQITAILNQGGGGDSGTLEFQVNVDAGLSTGELENIAEFEFNNSAGTTARQLTNAVTFKINHAAGVVANGSLTNSTDGIGEPVTVVSASQSQSVLFDNVIWNTGNGVDMFDISVDAVGSTFPAGTVFQALQSDGLSPLVDNSGNGLVDTGPVAPGAFYRVVLRLTVPADVSGDNAGAGFDVTLNAVSTTDPSIDNTTINHLDAVVVSTVDLTNNAALGEKGSMGEGLGPETSAVESRSVDPGDNALFLRVLKRNCG